MAYADVEELARVLQIRAPSAEQTEAMQRVLDAAAYEIDDWVGGYGTAGTVGVPPAFGTPSPPLVVEVNLERATEHWQQSQSPFAIIGFGDAVAVVAPRDSWERHGMKLAPLRRSWGIG